MQPTERHTAGFKINVKKFFADHENAMFIGYFDTHHECVQKTGVERKKS